MNIRDIQYILTIAEERNITKAANRLYISQPSLSQVLKRVEKELDVILFTRTTGGLHPTYIGEQFVSHGTEILNHYNQFRHFADSVSSLSAGRVNIGVPYYLNGSFLNEILPRFSQEYPGIIINVIQKPDEELEALLYACELDFIIGFSERIPEMLQKQDVIRCRLVLSVPSPHPIEVKAVQHPGERFPTLSPRELQGEVLLEYDEGHPIRTKTHAILDAFGVTMQSKLMSGYSAEMIRRCSSVGMGFGVIPESMLNPAIVNINRNYFYLEGDTGICHKVCTAWPKEAYLSAAAERLIGMSVAYFAER